MTTDITLPTFEDVNPTDVILQIEEPVEEVTAVIEEIPIEEEEIEEQPEAPEADPLARATYESLVEKGILEEDDTFNGTFEYLDEKFEQLPTKLLRSAINELPEHSQQVLKFIAAGGSTLDPEELKTYLKEYIGEQELPDVSTVDSARSFLEAEFKAQGLRPSAIQAQLDDLEDTDELLSEAEKILKSKERKTDTLIKEKEASNEANVKAQKQFVQEVTQTLSEIGWSKPQQQKIMEVIPKANNILGEIVKSPKAYVQLMDLLSKFNGKDFDLEAIKKQGESRAASTMKDKLNKAGFVSGSSKTTSTNESPLNDIFKDFKPIV